MLTFSWLSLFYIVCYRFFIFAFSPVPPHPPFVEQSGLWVRSDDDTLLISTSPSHFIEQCTSCLCLRKRLILTANVYPTNHMSFSKPVLAEDAVRLTLGLHSFSNTRYTRYISTSFLFSLAPLTFARLVRRPAFAAIAGAFAFTLVASH